MNGSSYRERDYAFGQLMLTVRTRLGLTQTELAEMLGVRRRAVIDWEGGLTTPTVFDQPFFQFFDARRRLSQLLFQREQLARRGCASPDGDYVSRSVPSLSGHRFSKSTSSWSPSFNRVRTRCSVSGRVRAVWKE